ncbi:MAG: Gfo/Idh/MocA family oxidoreductase, partial [Acidobacteriota bacterium]
MNVGIIGTGWGRIHCGTFRAAGCRVAAFLGRDASQARAVAEQEGVPVGTDDPADLESCDVVVIASPTPSHLEYLRYFRQKAVFCEKPLCDRPLTEGEVAELAGGDVFVNYAFPFLDSSRRLDRWLADGRIGDVRRVLLRVGVRFEGAKSPAAWFHDVAVHPLSWLLHRFGVFTARHFHVGGGPASIAAIFDGEAPGGPQLDVALYWLPAPGLRFEIDLVGDGAVASLRGGYAPGSGWAFEPPLLDGRVPDGPTAGDGERSDGEDVWYRANRRAVAAFRAVLDGRLRRDEALRSGSFDLVKAAAMEKML